MGLSASPRPLLAAACLVLALAAGGCSDVRDAGEELGWIRPPPTPVEAVVPSLEAHWIESATAIAGASHAQWVARWWQWTARFPKADEAPYRDPDGRWCTRYQEGPVWFLAGTDGSFDAVRNCRIPADKHLFVPLIAWHRTGPCGQTQAQVARLADHVTSGLVLLDGRPVGELKRLRLASRGCFPLGGSGQAASDGYWLMLAPLPPGKHQLAIAASYRDGPKRMLQNFRYELEVEGESDGTPETANSSQKPALRR